jgi:hypothetical protein
MMEREVGDGIIERRGPKKTVRVRQAMGDPIKEMSRICRNRVSKENRQEYDNEKRAKELNRRGYHQGQIAAMMGMGEGEVRRMVDHKTDRRRSRTGQSMYLDGDL